MQKLIIMLALVLAFAVPAMADSYTWTTGTLSTSAQYEVSSALPVQGHLERIVVLNSNGSAITNQVTLYNAIGASGAVGDTLCVVTSITTTAVAKTPRRLGTDPLSGVALTAAWGGDTTNVNSSVVVYPTERIYLGGDTRIKVLVAAPAVVTNVTTVTLIYQPDK